MRDLARRLRREGWRVLLTKRGHYKARPPDGGPFVVFSSTPSDGRAMKNTLADIRRARRSFAG